jgi:hypothetical protein
LRPVNRDLGKKLADWFQIDHRATLSSRNARPTVEVRIQRAILQAQ